MKDQKTGISFSIIMTAANNVQCHQHGKTVPHADGVHIIFITIVNWITVEFGAKLKAKSYF